MRTKITEEIEELLKSPTFQNEIKNADNIYKEFQEKYAPEKLKNLDDEDLLNTMFLNGNKDNMSWFLEFNPECRALMGSIKGGSSGKYGIYKSSGTDKWIYMNKSNLSNSEILVKARKIRDDLIGLCDAVKKYLTKLNSIKGYEELGKYANNQKLWVKKYLHMIFPDYFPTIYSAESVRACLQLLDVKSTNNECVQAGHLVLTAKAHNLKNFEFIHALYSLYPNLKEINLELKKTSYPKNQILYGPPGTGKTYNTILKAMEIITFEEMFKNWFTSIRQKGSENALDDYVKHIHKINNEYLKTQNIFSIYDQDTYLKLVDSIEGKVRNLYKSALDIYLEFLEYLGEGKEKYAKIRVEFERMKAHGRIDFITFHQSYSYEEFVEGIKPELSDNDIGGLRYTLSDGIFKRMCDEARSVRSEQKGQKIDFRKTRVFKMSLGGLSDASIYQYCIDNNVVSLGWGDNVDYSNADTLENIKKIYNEETGKDDWAPFAVCRFKNWMRKGDIIIISNRTRNFSAIAKVIGDYEYIENPDIAYHHFRKVQWLYKGDDIPVSKIYDKYLSQQSIYAFYNESKAGQDDYNSTIKTDVLNDIITGDIKNRENKAYVLVIDEINRGNISKIFGELITLIEDDKRDVLSTTLPYSQKSFTVPENLYIIGTMNTADRSIATIDIALRRRFKFIEIMPNSELLSTDIDGINLKSIMNNLNRRITVLLDRDHQIGHAYFMNIETTEDLINVWYNKILPLLNEYFYGDWNKLKLLVKPFIEEEEIPKDLIDECTDDKIYSFKALDETEFKEAIKELE